MTSWIRTHKPPLNVCPKKYCFFWCPPGGKVDTSGAEYDSFEEAIEATRSSGTMLPDGGCIPPGGPCERSTGNARDKDCYEPFNRFLKEDGLPVLFFCNPENLREADRHDYQVMAKMLWSAD